MQELRHAWRSLVKSPAFTAAAVLTLALGIGANTAIFSVVQASFLGRYPLRDPARLLRLCGEDPARDLSRLNLSVPKFDAVRRQQAAFEGLDAANYTAVTLLHQGDPQQVDAAWITAGFLQTFGVEPRVGRFFEPSEEEGSQVAVISETLWHGRFGAREDVVGSPLRLAGATYTIVGVAPALPAFWQAEVWLPDPFQLPGLSRDVLQRGVSFLATIGRLRAGVERAAAAQELAVIAARYRADHPDKADAGWKLSTVPLRDDVVGTARPAMLTLLGAVALVLLLACANVSNLLLVRFTGRRREIALRRALGAPRARVTRQFLYESLLVSLAAAALGTMIAHASLPALARMAQAFVPFATDIRLDGSVLVATMVLSLLAGVLTGAYPALVASRETFAGSLREGGRTVRADSGQNRMRQALVSGQVAVSLLLLVGAVLLLVSFARLAGQAPGFRPDHVFVAGLTLPATRYPDPESQGRFSLRLVEALRAAPEVVHAAAGTGVPLSGPGSRAPYAAVSGEVPPLKDRPLGLTRSVTPGYFTTLGIPLLAGRDFTEHDTLAAPLAVVLSQSTARKLYGNDDPLGRRVIMGSRGGGEEMEVIGVAADVRSQTLAETAPVEFYRPLTQRSSPFLQLAVRTRTDPASFASAARERVRQLDGELALTVPTTLSEVMARSLGTERLLFRLLALFAGLALTLATVGVYSVVAYTVRQRTSDIGVRMALGARPADIVGLTLGQGMVPVGIGITVGLLSCLALGRLIQSQLHGVSALSVAPLAAAGTALALIAGLACLVPARRASRIDPVSALRAE